MLALLNGFSILAVERFESGKRSPRRLASQLALRNAKRRLAARQTGFGWTERPCFLKRNGHHRRARA
jgi:hypothetical protein